MKKSKYFSRKINETDRVYMIMTDRFFDGDQTNNGTLGREYRPGNLSFYQGGDWKGIIKKLPYIKLLGFTAILISPPQENELFSRSGDEAGYHGYYTKDFNSVNQHFGTPEDLSELIQKSAKLGIKVILDVQLNHTADYLEYPSLIYDPEEYRPVSPFDTPSWYHNSPNIVDFTNPFEMQNYSLGGLDDLAQENPDCWNALLKAYWNPDNDSGWFSYGYAGSRIDAALEIPPLYLSHFEEYTKKPAFGECLTGSVDENAAAARHLWGILDYPLYFQINNTFCRKESWNGIHSVLSQDCKYKNPHHLFTFIDNHDRARFLANCSDNYEMLRLALIFIYCIRGIPIIYYGTEQNLCGDLKYSDENLNYSNREMMTSFDTSTSTFIYLKRLNAIREEYKSVFSAGSEIERYFKKDSFIYIFSRKNDVEKKEIICFFNSSNRQETLTLDIKKEDTYFNQGSTLIDLLNYDTRIPVFSSINLFCISITVSIPSCSALILTDRITTPWYPAKITSTNILIHCDSGWGNQLFIRGNVKPLNWNYGQKCENVASNLWRYIIERPISEILEFKILLNDISWESGTNHCIKKKEQIDVWPVF